MKNFYLAVFGLFSIGGAFAQIPNFSINSNPWPTSGNVGIGTNSPIKKLEVLQNISTTPTDIAFFGYRVFLPGIFPNPGRDNISGLYIQNKNSGPKLQFAATETRSPYSLTNLSYIDFSGGNLLFGYQNSSYMQIFTDGKVAISDGIALATPNGYRLFVEEGILTEKVKVAIAGTTNWADYVFADGYELMPLEKVEEFTKENKHLPNVPSADEMVKEGLDVATMDAKLLEKIEELTLYLIEQNKKLEEQGKKLEEQNKKFEEQNKKIEMLENELQQIKKQQD